MRPAPQRLKAVELADVFARIFTGRQQDFPKYRPEGFLVARERERERERETETERQRERETERDRERERRPSEHKYHVSGFYQPFFTVLEENEGRVAMAPPPTRRGGTRWHPVMRDVARLLLWCRSCQGACCEWIF